MTAEEKRKYERHTESYSMSFKYEAPKEKAVKINVKSMKKSNVEDITKKVDEMKVEDEKEDEVKNVEEKETIEEKIEEVKDEDRCTEEVQRVEENENVKDKGLEVKNVEGKTGEEKGDHNETKKGTEEDILDMSGKLDELKIQQ